MATKLLVEDHFTCSPEKLYSLLTDNAFDDELMAALKVGKKLVDHTDAASGPVYKLRLTTPNEIPVFAQKFTGEKLSYVENRVWNKSSFGNTWTITPEIKGASVECKGITTIVAEGTGCVRKTEGTITVNVPLIGRKIEEMVQKSITDTFKQNADFCAQYLKNH